MMDADTLRKLAAATQDKAYVQSSSFPSISTGSFTYPYSWGMTTAVDPHAAKLSALEAKVRGQEGAIQMLTQMVSELGKRLAAAEAALAAKPKCEASPDTAGSVLGRALSKHW